MHVETQEQPKKRRGRRPYSEMTEEEIQADKEKRAKAKADREIELRRQESQYDALRRRKSGKKYRDGQGGDWSEEMRASNKQTWEKKRAERKRKADALVAAQPHMTKAQLGISKQDEPEGYYGVALRNARVSFDLPPVNIKNPAEVQARISEYFNFCEMNNRPPNIIGMGNWLGVSTAIMTKWKQGDLSADHAVAPIIQRAMAVIEESLVNQVQENPKSMIGGMFLLKSMFHYKEQQDVVITTGDQKEELTADDIASRYLTDDKTVETTFAEDGDN